MKLLVESEISATSYKKLIARLKGMNKKELWEVLDHYIFHVMEDKEVDELLALLDQKNTKEEEPLQLAAEVDEPEYDSERFRPLVAFAVPSEDDLENGKNFLDLLYDQNCFDNYLSIEVKQATAQKLVEFSEKNKLPVCDHWKEYLNV